LNLDYSKKQRIKLILFISAVVIGVASLLYTNVLVNALAREERKKVELWASALKELETVDYNQDISFIVKILQDNTNVPVILVNEKDSILSVRNLDTLKLKDQKYISNQLKQMKKEHSPIRISSEVSENYVYYKDSILLIQLYYYPLVQLGVISLFIFVSYLVFSTSRKSEQNRVWVGMAKETAHQLGTPLSSLLAWIEMYRATETGQDVLVEVEKDVKRLETIAERFSKIGSTPVLTPQDVIGGLYNTVEYLKRRTSDNVTFEIHWPLNKEVILPLNSSLFEWVIENLCRNAVDSMNGSGRIDIFITENIDNVLIDIKDTGKGVPKNKFKTIFQPGFTTKKRGWGLGLSLSKRIIEEYHKGKIFVKSAEPNLGTTFRILLKTNLNS